jgi:hypothetical protein
MASCDGKASVTVLIVHYPGMPSPDAASPLWNAAAAIPGVTVLADEGGAECRRFGGVTSGQTLLYTPDGRLQFSGGITEGRGHSGDNAGRSSLQAYLLHLTPPPELTAETPVYGCPLFDESTPCQRQGDKPCCP